MVEIVKLETDRLNEFLATFDHYQSLIHTADITDDDEQYCDNTMLSYFNKIQTNVVLGIIPQWITEARRPPLTWYGFLSKSTPFQAESTPEERILAPEYYTDDSPTAMSGSMR